MDTIYFRLNSRDRIRTAFNSDPESGIVVVSGGSTLPPGSSTAPPQTLAMAPIVPTFLPLKKMSVLRFAEESVSGVGTLDGAKVGYEGISQPSFKV
jgi:hypothetical protein